MEIKKVRQTKEGTKLVVIPRNSNISSGDYVMITRVNAPMEVSA